MLAIVGVNQYFWSFFVLDYGAPSEKTTKDIKSYLEHILYATLYYRVQYTVCTHYSKYTAACAIHSRPYTVVPCTVHSVQYACTQYTGVHSYRCTSSMPRVHNITNCSTAVSAD